MKAIVVNDIGQALHIEEVPIPEPQQGEVRVKLKAAALNHRDFLIQKGKYVNLKFPMILGSDGAGTIDKLGEGVSNWSVGDQVIINPGLKWGDNKNIPGKDYRVLGMPDNGCFAEFVVVPASAIYKKPVHLNFEEAAAIPLSGLTGYRALVTRGQVTAGQKVLITGIGGAVAQMMLQFANAIGAEVYFTSGSDDKIEKAVSFGAKAGVNYKHDDWDKELKGLGGDNFDVIIDTAAGSAFDKLLDLAKPGAHIVIFGATAGPISQIMPQKIYLKQLNILGTTMGSPWDFEDMLKLIIDKGIVPVIDQVLPLDSAEEGIQIMESAKQFGKIVLSI